MSDFLRLVHADTEPELIESVVQQHSPLGFGFTFVLGSGDELEVTAEEMFGEEDPLSSFVENDNKEGLEEALGEFNDPVIFSWDAWKTLRKYIVEDESDDEETW